MVDKKRGFDFNLKNKVKNFSFREQYKKSFTYLKESRKFIYSVLILFFVVGLIGFFVSPPSGVEEKIMDFLRDLLNETEGFGCFEMIKYLFFNNIQSAFIGMILGVFLGIFPLIATVSNGYLVGFVGSLSVGEAGLGSLWRLLPHGIFELPAVFISLGLGVKLGSFVFHENSREKFNEFLKNSFRVFIFIVLPLLVMAGIIEGFLICSGV